MSDDSKKEKSPIPVSALLPAATETVREADALRSRREAEEARRLGAKVLVRHGVESAATPDLSHHHEGADTVGTGVPSQHSPTSHLYFEDELSDNSSPVNAPEQSPPLHAPAKTRGKRVAREFKIDGKIYVSLPTAAKRLSVTHMTLHRWASQKLLPDGTPLDVIQDPMSKHRFILNEHVERLAHRFTAVGSPENSARPTNQNYPPESSRTDASPQTKIPKRSK